MRAKIPTNIAACALRRPDRWRDSRHQYVEYACDDSKAFFTAADGTCASVVETVGEDGYRTMHHSQFTKEQRGFTDLPLDQRAAFPRYNEVFTQNAERVAHQTVVRLDVRRLDAIRKAINGQSGVVSLIIAGNRIAVVGEHGIGLIMEEGPDFTAIGKFKRIAEQYAKTVETARGF